MHLDGIFPTLCKGRCHSGDPAETHDWITGFYAYKGLWHLWGEEPQGDGDIVRWGQKVAQQQTHIERRELKCEC